MAEWPWLRTAVELSDSTHTKLDWLILTVIGEFPMVVFLKFQLEFLGPRFPSVFLPVSSQRKSEPMQIKQSWFCLWLRHKIFFQSSILTIKEKLRARESHRDSLWLSLALSGSLLLSEFAYKALVWLTRPLLGSERCSCTLNSSDYSNLYDYSTTPT